MFDKVIPHLESLADTKQAIILQRFFKTGPGEYGEGDRFRGIRVPVLRKLSVVYQQLDLQQADRLLQSVFHEDRMLALMILIRIYRTSDPELRKKIYQLYLSRTAYINNWDLVDLTAEHIVGAFLYDKDKSPLYRLARSQWLWDRRIAVLASFHYIKHHDYMDALQIIRIVLNDHHDLMHKAAGWMLREIGKRDLAAEELFLADTYKKMPRTMLRYAIEKFPEPRRQAYLKGTVKSEHEAT